MYPQYSYHSPITYYPHFPAEHWPDDPFDPRLYPGYPYNPNDAITKFNQNPRVEPSDVKLRWPQNAFYTWPESADYRWPEESRFEWPTSPSDPQWIWSSCPELDAKWRRPANPSNLPNPIPQRRPEDPFAPGKPINRNPSSDDITPPRGSPRDFPPGTIPRFGFPKIDPNPEPSPGFTFPDPNFFIVLPHTRAPFPVIPADFCKVYKGIPNQPLGLLPPNAIPAWESINPRIYVIDKRTLPNAPPGTKWITYFYYPLPHRTAVTNRVGLVPQLILVDVNYPPLTVRPITIPVMIILPAHIKLPEDPRNPGTPSFVEYMMPVLTKPVDPKLRFKIIMRNYQDKATKARFDQNKKIDDVNWNRTQPGQPGQPGQSGQPG